MRSDVQTQGRSAYAREPEDLPFPHPGQGGNRHDIGRLGSLSLTGPQQSVNLPPRETGAALLVPWQDGSWGPFPDSPFLSEPEQMAEDRQLTIDGGRGERPLETFGLGDAILLILGDPLPSDLGQRCPLAEMPLEMNQNLLVPLDGRFPFAILTLLLACFSLSLVFELPH